MMKTLALLVALMLTMVTSGVTSEDQLTQGDTSPGSCNTCCQDQPGHNGHNGQPGRDGFKGDKGDQGLSYGIKGDKGDQGNLPQIQKSAFTAIKNAVQTGNNGDVVSFQGVTTNINNDFDPYTYKFTCQFPGTYVFFFSIFANQPLDAPLIHMVKNNNVVVTAHSRTLSTTDGSTDNDQATNGAVLNLQAGDQVWLRFGNSGHHIHANQNHNYNSFSGFLLYAN